MSFEPTADEQPKKKFKADETETVASKPVETGEIDINGISYKKYNCVICDKLLNKIEVITHKCSLNSV